MKTATSSLRRDFQALLIKTGMALTLPILIFLLVGCVPEELTDKNFGPKFRASEIDAALSEVLGPADILSIQKYEYAERLQIADITGRTSVPQGANSLEVIDYTKTETETEITLDLNLVRTTVTYDEYGNPSQPVSQSHPLGFSICKTDDCASAMSAVVVKPTAASLKPQFAKLWSMVHNLSESEAPAITDITYHNLKIVRERIRPPKAVMDAPNCRGLSPCELNVTGVTYDVVLWDENDEARVFEFEYLTSPQLPFFSRYKLYVESDGQRGLTSSPLKFCQTYAIQTSRVKLCEELKDFLPGVEEDPVAE